MYVCVYVCVVVAGYMLAYMFHKKQDGVLYRGGCKEETWQSRPPPGLAVTPGIVGKGTRATGSISIL